LCVRCAKKRGSSFVWTPKTTEPSLDPACPEHLSVQSPANLPYLLSTNSRKTLLVRDFTGHKEMKQSRYVAGKNKRMKASYKTIRTQHEEDSRDPQEPYG